MHVERRRRGHDVPACAPILAAPMDESGLGKLDPQDLSGGDDLRFLIAAPGHVPGMHTVDLVALARLRRHVEDALFPKRAQQLDMLGMRPDERHRRSRGPAAEELALRNILAVPDLLRQAMPVAATPLHSA